MPIREVTFKSGRRGFRRNVYGKIYPTREEAELRSSYALAFDEASRRRIDENGYLHVSQTHLTKEQVAPYYGREIPGNKDLGLDPERVYYGYRSAAELDKAKDTFNGMPLLIVHKQDSAGTPLKDERVGSIGTTPVWSAPYLDNSLTVTDQSAIDAIASGKLKEISCGYYFEPDFTAGEFNGVHYDFVMRNIRGNHVALVKEGRAGPDVAVHDAMPSTLRKKVTKNMKLTRAQVAVRAALSTYLKPRLAMDAAHADLTKLVGSYKKPATLAKAVVRKYGNQLAQDMEIEPEELAELMEAVEEEVKPEEEIKVEEETTFDDDNVSESLRAMLEGKVPDELLVKLLECLEEPIGDDELTPEEKEAKEKAEKEKAEKEKAASEKSGAPAMDANAIKLQARTEAQSHFRSLNEAGRKVRELIGEVDVMAFDSAEDIYGHALKQKGVKIGQYEKSSYKGMVDMLAANKPSLAPAPTFDAAPGTLQGPFAGLNKIKL